MKKLLVLALLALMVSGAFAQGDTNSMGVFFTNDIEAIVAADDAANPEGEAVSPYTNAPIGQFVAYIVLLYPSVESVGGYEIGLTFSAPSIFVSAVEGPNGWLNVGGTPTNHAVGYGIPLPVNGDGVVLCTLTGGAYAPGTLTGHDSTPSSIPGGLPVIADGTNPDILIQCDLTGADGVLATFAGEGVVPAAEMSFSNVKALF